MSDFVARTTAQTRVRRTVARASFALFALALAACNPDEILDVQDPDVVTPENINDESGLPLLLAGAVSDFQNAYNGSTTEGQANMVGLFTDEFIQTESFPTRFEVEIRDIRRENNTMGAIFLDLSRARASAERAARKYVEFDQADALGRAQALNLAGYAYIFFAENYCSGVPFSTLNDDLTITTGEPQTTQEMLEAAVAKFDTALTIATSADNAGAAATAQAHLARVGRGRALLDLGQFAEAANAVAMVPTGFQYVIQHSENSFRQNNGVWQYSTSQGRWGVSEDEAEEGLAFRTANDIRVPNRRRLAGGGNGFDGAPMFEQLKYDERIDPIILASGVEARLIEAEAALRAGNTGTFISKLNEPRASAQVRQARDLQRYAPAGTTLDELLPPLADPGSEAARVDLLFRERAFWLYATSHRLGDLRRLVRQYGRAANEVFPSGTYSSPGGLRTGTYGTDVNFPIPIAEDNNPDFEAGAPNLKGCIDRSA